MPLLRDDLGAVVFLNVGGVFRKFHPGDEVPDDVVGAGSYLFVESGGARRGKSGGRRTGRKPTKQASG